MAHVGRGTLRRQTFEGSRLYAVRGPGPDPFTIESDREGPDGMHVKTLDSRPGQVEELPTGKQLSPKPSVWSSDGTVLLYVVTDPVTYQDIWTYSAGDGETRPWLATQYRERHPDLSPDDRRVAYDSTQSGRFEVDVRPLDGRGDAPIRPASPSRTV